MHFTKLPVRSVVGSVFSFLILVILVFSPFPDPNGYDLFFVFEFCVLSLTLLFKFVLKHG